jgi:hypothetical protein
MSVVQMFGVNGRSFVIPQCNSYVEWKVEIERIGNALRKLGYELHIDPNGKFSVVKADYSQTMSR